LLARFRLLSNYRSLKGRLILLWIMVVAASLTAGLLMVAIFRQSTAAQAGRAEAVVARSCDAIGRNYQFYMTNWRGPAPRLEGPELRRDLTNVVQMALRDQPGVEGGIWQTEAGALAYAYPTYEGSGPKTDIPQAELERIQEINVSAATEDISKRQRTEGRSQTLLLYACPLPGVIHALTAWTMTRVATAAGEGYAQLRLGLGVLFACVAGAAFLLTRLLFTWSRHVAGIETSLASHEQADLPALAQTGERDLDRIVMALNQAGSRLAEARRRSEGMTRQMAIAERLAAIGRMTAAFAHEIRNPITAMRLKAENALASDDQRRQVALSAIIEQIGRLDRLVEQLLRASHRREPQVRPVNLKELLETIAAAHREVAAARCVKLTMRSDVESVNLDAVMLRSALDNLLGNALRHVPENGEVAVTAECMAEKLMIRVRDTGAGVPLELRSAIFEPFVTGRSNGTGLGLWIARETVESHGGQLRLVPSGVGACFEIELPWQPS
jgi:signal transduction histidine kinase